MRRDLAASISNTLYFGGEAVAWPSPSTVDGAYNTGIWNAQCILQATECTPPPSPISPSSDDDVQGVTAVFILIGCSILILLVCMGVCLYLKYWRGAFCEKLRKVPRQSIRGPQNNKNRARRPSFQSNKRSNDGVEDIMLTRRQSSEEYGKMSGGYETVLDEEKMGVEHVQGLELYE